MDDGFDTAMVAALAWQSQDERELESLQESNCGRETEFSRNSNGYGRLLLG